MTISTSPFAQTYSITKLIESKVNKDKVKKIYFLPAWTRAKIAAGVTATIENQNAIYAILRDLFPGLDIFVLGSTNTNETFQNLAEIFDWKSLVLNSEEQDKSKIVLNEREILLPRMLFDEESLFINYSVPVPHKDLLVSGAIANTSQLLMKDDREYVKSLLDDEALMFLGELAKNYKAQFINVMEVFDIFKIDTSSISDLDPLEQYVKMHSLAKDKTFYSKEELGEFWISNKANELDLFAFYKIWNGMPVREGSWFFIQPEPEKAEESAPEKVDEPIQEPTSENPSALVKANEAEITPDPGIAPEADKIAIAEDDEEKDDDSTLYQKDDETETK